MKKDKIKHILVKFVAFFIPLILIWCIFLIFFDKKVKSVNEIGENKAKYLSIVMVGDVLIHKTLYEEAKVDDNNYNFSYMFDEVKELFNGYDLKFYNQESIIGDKSLGLSTYPRFNSPDEIGDTMIKMGFNLVSLANNQSLDKGEKGIINSLNYWENKDVVTSGMFLNEKEKSKERIYESNGIKYAFFAYAEHTNGIQTPKNKEYLVNIYSDNQAYEDITKIKDKVDLIIVSMHWGNEYQNIPSQKQKNIASFLSTLGVDIIIGHHPHVIQPIELINDTLVFYSLGNFISGQNTNDRLTGLISSINIEFKKGNKKLKKEIKNINADLVYTYHNNYKNYKVIPYTKLTTKEFNEYKNYYSKYYKVLTSLNGRVIVTNIEE